MKYEVKKRRERYWEIDPETLEPARDPLDGVLMAKKSRIVERLEWEAKDGTRFRTPITPEGEAILDRRVAQEAEDGS